jgi:Ca2+-binding RTX toxin-like protein
VELDEAWQAVIDAATVRLAAQGPLAEVFADATYSVDSDRVEADIGTTLADTVHRILEELPATSGSALAEWSETWAPMLKAFMEASVRHDGNLIRDDFIVMSLVRAMQGVTLPLTLAQLATDLDLENVLIGGGGADILSRSGSGSFVFVGDAGNDILTGSGGQGVYVFGAGFGQDTIIDADLGEQGDRIRFALHGRDDVTLARVGVDLVITIDGTADKITVRNHFAGLTLGGDYGVEEIQFADGTLLDVRQIAEAVGRGTSAGETLDGSALEDQIEGLQGNDTLRGGDGGDTYYFSAGHGDDVIHDIQSTPAHQTADMVIVENGLSMNDVVFSRQGAGDDLLMTFATGDSILIKGQFWYSSLGIRGGIAPEGLIGGLLNNPFIGGSNLALDNRMEAFLFKAGGSLTWLDVQNRLIEQHTTSAADVAHGFATGDRFGASAGNDIMYGYDGGDVYEFGRGSNADTIHDQALYLTLLGTDTVLFGEGVEFEDLVIKRIEGTKDLLISIAGTGDSLTIKEQFDGRMIDLFGIFGVQWFSRIETFRFADGSSLDWEDILDMVTTGGAGDDWLAGDFRVDTLNGGAGNDFLDGGDDGDVYMFGNGDGQDVIRDTPGYVIGTAPDKLVFKAGVDVADVVFTRDGSSDDLIVSIVGSTDQVRIQNQYVVTETGVFGALAFNQIEQFHWADGTIRTWTSIVAETIAAATTEGDDTILGWHFDDLIVGAGGDDLLKGGNGSDTYLFDLGDGADIILDHNVNLFTGNDDVIQFGAEISSGDIVLGRVGDDLVVSIDGTSDQITVQGHFQYSTLNLREYEMEAIRFDGGEAWTAADVRLRLIDAAATAGADIVAGFQTDDRLDGRAGDDVLRGGDGSDTYVFGLNFGSDTIEEFVDNVAYDDADAIEFAVGYDSGDVLFSRSGDDLIISFAGLGDQVVVSGQFDNAAWFSGWTDIEQITFGDDVVFTEVQIRETLLAQARTSGADTIEGFYTADALDGGAGNDILRGAGGGDTYAFGKGSGQDVIEETFATVYEDDPDTVLFSTGVARSEVTFTRVGDDMVVAIAGVSDTLTIRDHFVSTREGRVEFFRFANGTTLTAAEAETNAIAAQSTPGADTITGAAGDDLLDGGTGNDALQGNAGNDTYRFGRGYGQDTIQETSGTWGDAADALAFSADVLPEDLVLTRVGANLIIGISGTTDVLTIVNQVLSTDSGGIYGNQRIERFVFGDGTEWTAAEMDLQLLLAQQTSGNDTIVGYESDDVIDGGGGADFMQGGDGDDTYWFGRGSGSDTISETDAAWGDPGDAIRFSDGVVAGDLLFSRQGNNLIIKISGTTDQLVLVNQLWSTNSAGIYGAERVERFVFADGSELSAVEVEDRLLAAQQTSGNDSVYGYESSDVIDGGAGNDFLQGGQANDTYRFGLGDGVDVIDETNAAYGDLDDILAFKDGVVMDDLTWARSGNDLVISIAGTGDKVTIRNQFWSLDSTSVLGFGRIERFVFTDGSELSAPQIDALTLLSHQTSGNDTILGYSTPDRLDGGAGNDLMTGGGGADVYVFGRGYDQDTIDETNETYGAPNDAIAFATGVSQGDITWSRAGNDLVIRIVGTDDRLTIKNQFWSLDSSGVLGFGRVERFVFADGTELSAPEVDQLTLLAHQTPGADTVTGYSTADTIDAGTGNDLITGNGGNDTYFFGRGYGQDTIDETNGTYGDLADRVIFRADIAPEDLVLSRSGLDLVIGVGSDRLILRYQLFSTDSASLLGYNRVEYFEFAGGVVWTAADMDATLLDQAATAGDDVITGFASADTINGQGGDDELIGGAGNDQLRGSAGDDILSGGIGEDTALYADASTDIRWVRQADGSIHAINDVTAEVDVLRDVEGAWFEGDETYVAMNEAVAAYGTNGDDSWLPGTSGADSIYGRDGDDALVGRGGDDLLDGGEGYDQANYAGAFTDFAFQRAADGSIIVTDAAGPEGADTLTGVEAVYFEGDQTWKELENLVAAYGTSGSDAWLEGTEGSDDVYALAGDDSLVGRDGNDRLFGGDGYDQANYFGSSTDFSVVLNPDGTVTITDLVGDEGADVLDSVEAVYFEGDQTWSTIEDAIGGGGLTGLLQEKARGGASQPPGPEVLPSLPNDEHPLKVTDDGPPLVLPSLIGEDFLPKVTGDDGPLVLPGVADDGLPSGAGHPGRALLQALFASTHDAWTLQGRHGCLVDDFGGAAHKPVDDLLGF